MKDTVEVVREGEGKRRRRREGGGGGSGGGGGNGGSDGGVGGGGSEGEWGTQITHILLDFLPAHTHSTLSWCILHRLSPHNKASYDITRAAGHPPQERGASTPIHTLFLITGESLAETHHSPPPLPCFLLTFWMK